MQEFRDFGTTVLLAIIVLVLILFLFFGLNLIADGQTAQQVITCDVVESKAENTVRVKCDDPDNTYNFPQDWIAQWATEMVGLTTRVGDPLVFRLVNNGKYSFDAQLTRDEIKRRAIARADAECGQREPIGTKDPRKEKP